MLFLVLCLEIHTAAPARGAGEPPALAVVDAHPCLNLRPEPGPSGTPIDCVTTATQVEILADRGAWKQVRLPEGLRGWMAGDYLLPVRAEKQPPIRPPEQIAERQPRREEAVQVRPAYSVGPADIVTVEVYDNADLCGDFTVDPSGSIDYPLLGQLRVAGMSIAEIEETLSELLERDYLYEAIVTAKVKEHRSQKVEIHGDVGKPGIYYLDGPLSLLGLLASADGISGQLGNPASHRQARIAMTRPNGVPADHAETDGKEPAILLVDLHDLLIEGRQEADVPLADGYVIYIPPVLTEDSTIHVLGEVNSPGPLPFEEGITVMRAITLAGGATKKAVVKKAFLSREQEGEILKVRVALDDLLQPGDILTIPVSFW
ncbi:MAG: SH3 domain-containing protein [bacterium]|nr:SH3 domain-containing protein [bacterium]